MSPTGVRVSRGMMIRELLGAERTDVFFERQFASLPACVARKRIGSSGTIVDSTVFVEISAESQFLGLKFVRESKSFASVHVEVTRSRHVFVLGPEAEVNDDEIAEDCTWASEGRRLPHRQIQLVLLRDVSSEQLHVLTVPGYPIDADPFVVLQDHASGEIDPEPIQFIVQQLLVCVLCELPIPQAEAIVRVVS